MNRSSKEVKSDLLFYFLYSRGFLYATTEMGTYDGYSFKADIVAVNKNYKFYEVEIKTSFGDLKNELETIDYITNNTEVKSNLAKYYKHKEYLKKTEHIERFIPHRFYFALPYENKKYALEKLKNTPYGVMDLDGNVFKTAKDLHNRVIEKDFLEKMLQRLSRENYNLSKKYEMELSSKNEKS